MNTLCVLICLSIVCISNGEFITYNNHRVFPQRPEYMAFPKYSKKDVPNWAPGKGRSFIDLSQLQFSVDCTYLPDDCGPTTLELLLFEEPTEFPWLDYWPDNNLCCSKDLIDAGVCFKEKTLIVPATLAERLTQSVTLTKDESYSPSSQDPIYHHDIIQTGVYVLIMAVCDEDGSPVVINGVVDSMDPYGYLPADLFGNLPFYETLSFLYSFVGVIWFIVCVCYSAELMKLQYWITAVLFLGMVESSMLYGHYLSWNDYGKPSYSVTVIGLLFGVIKRTLSRVVVQFVALGYGVVRPSLGDDMKRVLLLGSAYFVLSLIYTFQSNFPSSGSKQVGEFDLVMLIVLLLEGVDTTFYIWIVSSINNLMVSLAARRQAVKYVLYRDFRSVLFVSIFFTAAGLLYEIILEANSGHGSDGAWKSKWTSSALFELTYFAVFVAIAYLWAPSKNSQRYAAYDSIEMGNLNNDQEWNESQEMFDDDEDEEGTSKPQSPPKHAAISTGDGEVDAEYGGRLHDDNDPFERSGALDPAMAIQKKN